MTRSFYAESIRRDLEGIEEDTLGDFRFPSTRWFNSFHLEDMCLISMRHVYSEW